MVVRRSFESTIVSRFYGHGPLDAFFQKYSCIGVQDIVDLYESFVITMEKGISPCVSCWNTSDKVLFGSGDKEALPEWNG